LETLSQVLRNNNGIDLGLDEYGTDRTEKPFLLLGAAVILAFVIPFD
jgi:hypothetical protein